MLAPLSPDRLIRRLRDLVRIPSLTGDEAAAMDRIADWLNSTEAEVDRWDVEMTTLEADPDYPGREVERDVVPVLAARVVGDRPGPAVMLTGHVDVVPPGDGWRYAPFAAEVEGDRLYGRGACDMKAGLAAALEVFTACAEGPRDFAGTLVFVAVPGEEDGGTGTLAAIRRGWRADAALIAEPTASVTAGGQLEPPRMVLAHGGALTLRLTVPGRSAHACFRRDGENALDHFITLYRALQEAEVRLNEGEADPRLRALGLPYPTNVGCIRGGDWASTVMSTLQAEIRVGAALGESVPEAEARVRRVIESAAAEVPWMRENPPTLELTGGAFAASATAPDHPLVQALSAASADVFGAPAVQAAMPYGCDMRLWRNLADVPTVVYGPGHARLAHTIDEWVSLTQTRQVAEVMAGWVTRMSGQANAEPPH